MKGYAGKLLRVNLSDGKVSKEEISDKSKRDFIGGRGFALKVLWEEVKNVDPISEDNKIVFSTGPLTGQFLPSSGKMVIASKSPLTGGYGDGNIGTMASLHLKKAGYDVLIVEGKSRIPCYLFIQDQDVKIVDAQDLWGKNTYEAQDILEEKHGKNSGILLIGPGGENKVRFAVVVSQKGRAGGRPGMGAVMGSKNLKAVVIKGSGSMPDVYDNKKMKEIGQKGYEELKTRDSYNIWVRQGTMQVIEWANENSCLPTYNFREGVYAHAKEVDGYIVEKMKVARRGCPMCNAQCGNVVMDSGGELSELDYENVAMLGPNVGLKDLRQVALLNRLADQMSLDAISLGSCIGFLMEASENKLIPERIEWGNFEAAQRIVADIIKGEGLGRIMANGVRTASEIIGQGSNKWAMQVKGLEISAYNCHACPGMALSYGVSPIGAHHKDAWVISWEISTDRMSYNKEKVSKIIELQRMRGGFFESFTVCRLPWVDINFGLHWYPEYFEAITGVPFSWEGSYKIGDRINNLMRSFWIRENPKINRSWDYPPDRWFEESLSQGRLKGTKLDRAKYDQMLSWYYELQGWDQNGIPLKSTLENVGLAEVAKEIKL